MAELTEKDKKTMASIAKGTYAESLMKNYSRNVNGGVIGGVIGGLYALKTHSSVLSYGIFGFVMGAIITGIFFKPKE